MPVWYKKRPLVFAAFCPVLTEPRQHQMPPKIAFTLSVISQFQSEVADSI